MTDLIFSINTGRCGSHYLATILRHAVGCEAYHEPHPNMQGVPMIEWNTGNPDPLREAFKAKRVKIDAALSKGHIYAETNNAFIKGYGDLVAETYPSRNIGVVVLSRPHAEVVDSLNAVGYYSSYYPPNEWLLRPWHNTALVEYKEHHRTEADWYVDEVRARGELFREMYPQIKYYGVTLNQLNDYDQVCEMLEFFNLTPMDSLKGVVGVATNQR